MATQWQPPAAAAAENKPDPYAKSFIARHDRCAKKPVQLTQLYNPVINIDYGTDYLNYLRKRNDGNLLMATAAYNAGYSRVKQWIPKTHALPADVWVETIPYRETRDYVKAVMAYYQIYNIRLNTPTDVFKPLTTMQIGVVVE